MDDANARPILDRVRGLGIFPNQFYGQAPVPDDDGLENLLVHVVGMTGEWLWSGVIPEYYNMDLVQDMFHRADPERFGLDRDHYYKLVYQLNRQGPYPPECDRVRSYPSNGRPLYALHDHLGKVDQVVRADDTRQVWITAVWVQVI